MVKNTFQHSLMSMFDPRMKHLVDNEGLRGLVPTGLSSKNCQSCQNRARNWIISVPTATARKLPYAILRKSSWNTTFLNWKKTDTLCPKS